MNEENKTLASIKDLTELEEYADLAYNFLHGETGEEQEKNEYSNDKKIIQSLFDKEEYTFSDLKLQLIVIDSVYSTNASKNNDAIKEITEKFFEVFKKSDKIKEEKKITKKDISESFKSLLNNSNDSDDNEIHEVFVSTYGFQKADTSKSKQAISLISKYGYFITKYKFPIYDSFVIDNYRVLKKNNIECLGNNAIDKDIKLFLEKMNLVTEKVWKDEEQKRYEKLDNLMWVIGKIRKDGFPLLLGKKLYEELVEKIKYTGSYKKGDNKTRSNVSKYSEEIFKNIEEIDENIINEKLNELIRFSNF